MTVRINNDKVAVDHNYFWRSMDTCPRHVKVQLLNLGGVAVYGKWNGEPDIWRAWAPLPKFRKVK